MQLLLDSEQYSTANQMLVLLLLHHQFNNQAPMEKSIYCGTDTFTLHNESNHFHYCTQTRPSTYSADFDAKSLQHYITTDPLRIRSDIRSTLLIIHPSFSVRRDINVVCIFE